MSSGENTDGADKRLTVSSSRSFNFLHRKIRSILQKEQSCRVVAFGLNMDKLIDIVENLKRMEIVKVDRVSTDIIPKDESRPGTSLIARMKLEILLGRGEKFMILTGSRSHKVVQLFEKMDVKKESFVSVESVRRLMEGEHGNLGQDSLFGNAADEFLESLEHENEGKVLLKDFLLYFSLIAGPVSSKDSFEAAIDALSQELEQH